jgi:hypothetical protein
MYCLNNPIKEGAWKTDYHLSTLWNALENPNPRLCTVPYFLRERSFLEIAMNRGLPLTARAMKDKDPTLVLSREEFEVLNKNSQNNGFTVYDSQETREAMKSIKPE